MYNRNYDGFDYIRIHTELLNIGFNQKKHNTKPITDGYTKPLNEPKKPTTFQLKKPFNTILVSVCY